MSKGWNVPLTPPINWFKPEAIAFNTTPAARLFEESETSVRWSTTTAAMDVYRECEWTGAFLPNSVTTHRDAVPGRKPGIAPRTMSTTAIGFSWNATATVQPDFGCMARSWIALLSAFKGIKLSIPSAMKSGRSSRCRMRKRRSSDAGTMNRMGNERLYLRTSKRSCLRRLALPGGYSIAKRVLVYSEHATTTRIYDAF